MCQGRHIFSCFFLSKKYFRVITWVAAGIRGRGLRAVRVRKLGRVCGRCACRGVVLRDASHRFFAAVWASESS